MFIHRKNGQQGKLNLFHLYAISTREHEKENIFTSLLPLIKENYNINLRLLTPQGLSLHDKTL
jgi:hypothetical protein